ncbi:hypothetical protein AWU65_28560 [Paenibacillus glucanolyticus]|uniref:Uncharacterized protein n=1 Tax=Paenibacillus glucanolyticus TaxID=59843 RepID=A0A163EUL5_9BACL|nr:hypothetical protein [Paenibacillus glucanolyticus]KZS44028.1 hypothetical protein AWU65_28560 [Paenibacillus glucanolyticus]
MDEKRSLHNLAWIWEKRKSPEGARLLELDIFILFFIGKSEKESERKKAEACERELGTVGLIFTLSA